MKLSSFTAYVKQLWKNKPDTSTPNSGKTDTYGRRNKRKQ